MTGRTTQFTEVAEKVWVYASDGGPNSGVVLGDDGIMVVDGQPNAGAAGDFASRIADLRAGPVTSVALTHFHASRWAHLDVFPGAALITSRKCRTEMLHRGAGELEVAHLRDGVDLSPGGLTAPPDARLAFKNGLSVFLGGLKVELLHFGRGHTSGDAVVWVQDAGVLFAGDLVEREVAPFVGDAAAPEWISTLDRLAPYRPAVMIPGRGGATSGAAASIDAFGAQRAFIEDIWALGARASDAADDLAGVIRFMHEQASRAMKATPLWKTRLPFAAARLMDVAGGASIPKIWTPDRVRAALAAFREALPY